MNTSRTLVLSAAVMIAAAAPAFAASIGVNFGDPNPSNEGQILPFTLSAGVVPQINWMNVTTTSATALTLSDSTGAATSAQLTYIGNGFPNLQAPAFVDETNGNELLNNSLLSGPGSSITFTITGISYSSYNVIAYTSSFLVGRTHVVTVGSTTYYGLSPNSTSAGYVDGNTGTPGYTYTQGTSTNSGSPTPNANYFLFTGVTGSTLTLTMSTPNDVPQMTAFQIVDAVPEPCGAMLLVGGFGMLGLRRFRRAS